MAMETLHAVDATPAVALCSFQTHTLPPVHLSTPSLRAVACWFMQVDCTKEQQLCKDHFVTAFPSIRVFRQAHDDVVVNVSQQSRGMKSGEKGCSPGARVTAAC